MAKALLLKSIIIFIVLVLLPALLLAADNTGSSFTNSSTLILAFMLSELKRAFQMGFMIYISFLVIDMMSPRPSCPWV